MEEYKNIDGRMVNTSTGEIQEMINVSIPVGSKIVTPEQQANQVKYAKEQMRRRDEHFYFILHQHQLNQISAESAGRLIYLLTFLDYNGNFMVTERQPMSKKDLSEVLKISNRTIYRFCDEVFPKYLTESNGRLKLNCNDIVKGKLPDRNKYQKFNTENIKILYENTAKTKHKHLGYVYQLLPFINMEYNIICNNPYESDNYEIDAITSGEFCEKIGYDESQFCRLRKIYNEITFNVNGREEHLLIYTSATGDRCDWKLIVNPNIIYNGHKFNEVKAFGFLAKVRNKSK